MMTYQVQVPIGNLPISLVLVGNRQQGAVVIVKLGSFSPIFDQCGADGVSGVFDNESFALHKGEETKEFFYDTIYEYKEIPLLLKWLQQQNLQEPQTIFG